MAEAILLFAGDNVWTQDLDRKTKYWIHGILLLLGCGLLTAGISIMINQKGGVNHFVSTHAITGKIMLAIRHLIK